MSERIIPAILKNGGDLQEVATTLFLVFDGWPRNWQGADEYIT